MDKKKESSCLPDMKKSTDDLNKIIREKKDIKDFFKENSNELMFSSLADLLEFYIHSKSLDKSEVLEKANMVKSYGYELFNGNKKNPSRDKLIALCFGMELNLDETNHVLKQAGLSELYVRRPRDAIIMNSISHNKSLMETNETLDELGEDPIGEY